MTATKDVTQILIRCLSEELDPHLADRRFHRSDKSLEYFRPIEAGRQYIKLVFDVNPRYEPRALAHLLPQIRLVLPELNQRVLDMMGDMPSLENVDDITFFQQLQNAAPRDVRTGPPTRWFVFDLESARQCVASMRGFMEQWTIPFLNRYSTISALTEGYEQQDECLPHDRRFWLFIAAAYTLLEQPAKAMQVLESRFGKAGLRRQYAKAFESVSALLVKG
jgi:hypothetical protein